MQITYKGKTLVDSNQIYVAVDQDASVTIGIDGPRALYRVVMTDQDLARITAMLQSIASSE
jgi:hypothetical protein